MDLVLNPFGDATKQAGGALQSASAGAMQARDSAEVFTLYVMAQRFPRNPVEAAARIANAFTRPTLAAESEYQFSRGGTDIKGPSIRAAEAIAQQWGNMSAGWRETARWVGPDGVGISEVEAFSVDLETRHREGITFQVRHWRDTKKGGYALKDERDIYELCANQAQRRKRACILASVPGDVVEMAMQQVAVTLATSADTSPEAVGKLVQAFAPYGVTKKHLEQRIQRSLDSIAPAQIISLRRIFTSLRDDMSQPADWFDFEDGEALDADALKAVRTAAAARRAERKGESIDPQTGEVRQAGAKASDQGAKPEAAAAAKKVAPKAEAAEVKPAGPTFAKLADLVVKAKTRDEALFALKEGAGLPDDQRADLQAAFDRKWGAA